MGLRTAEGRLRSCRRRGGESRGGGSRDVNSKLPKVSYLVICYNRRDDVKVCVTSILAQDYPDLEIVVVDNASVDGTDTLFQQELTDQRIVYRKMSENFGVSGGRNAALEVAVGQVLITIDDDAMLIDPLMTRKVVERLGEDPEVGVLAFRIEDFVTTEIQRMFFPWKDKSRDPGMEFETTWFIGAGHAITRKVYDTVGVYRDYRPYGAEEFDLALRILDNNFKIIYFPGARIRHKESKKSRIPPTKLSALRLKHRMRAVILNLPWFSVLSFFVIRSGVTLLKSRGNVVALGMAYWAIISNLGRWLDERKPIGPSAIAKLGQLNGPLYY